MNRTVRCGTVAAVWVCALLSAVHVCRGADAGAGSVEAASGDWPQWRGPERNGLGTGGPVLASAWPAAGPVKLWESELIPVNAEHGWSTPAVADGRVYLSFGMNPANKRHDVFLCLDAANGKTLWKRDYPGTGPLMDGSSSTVCATSNRLFGAGSDSALYCLNSPPEMSAEADALSEKGGRIPREFMAHLRAIGAPATQDGSLRRR